MPYIVFQLDRVMEGISTVIYLFHCHNMLMINKDDTVKFVLFCFGSTPWQSNSLARSLYLLGAPVLTLL